MAIDMVSRWQTIRELSYFKKSGTLTVQIGRTYLTWIVNQGELLWFASSSAEYSFTRFLYESGAIEPDDITAAQSMIGASRSLGAALIQKRIAEPDTLRQLLRRHGVHNIHHIVAPGSHILLSSQIDPPKQHMLSLDMSFSEMLLHCERSSLDIRSAVQFAEETLGRYRIHEFEAIERGLHENEKRILPYLKCGASLQEILSDPELDRLTCYRVLFLLWIAGYLQQIQPRVRADTTKRRLQIIRTTVKAIPPEWIFPLVLGILLGVILAPENDAPQPAPQPSHRQPLIDPAWRDP